MITRLVKSKLDIENLSRLKTLTPCLESKFSYKGIIVKKPWGYEYLMFQNKEVAIWILFLRQGHSTSMHCHPNKKSSLTVLSGKIVLYTLEGWYEIKKGGSAMIDEGVFHSSKTTSKEGTLIMEIESPPNKKDLARLKDNYGRENLEYEGEDMFTKKKSDYEYVDFHKIKTKGKKRKVIRDCTLTLSAYFNYSQTSISQKLKRESGNLISVLTGELRQKNGDIILSPPDIALLKDIQEQPELLAVKDLTYLIIKHDK